MFSLFNHPILGRGFRSFFLLGAVYSTISIIIWGGFYAGYVTPPSTLADPISWHAHEMIFGFTLAIIAGFLLTAVANWTGSAPARQRHLAGLCMLWLAGRVVMNFDLGLQESIIFIIEGSFVLALAITLAIPLFKSWNKRNFIFLILLSILFSCNIAFLTTQDPTPLYIAIMVIITMISLIGGRIIPAFTVAALRQRGISANQTPQGKMDILALMSLSLIMLTLAFLGTQGVLLSVFAFFSALIHIMRLRHYHTRKICNDPMVWILHIGYCWVIIGLIFIGMASLGLSPFSLSLHAFTVGAIGSMTIGMMCRVALGHTGRNLIATKFTTVSFIIIQIAAIMRIFGPLILPEYSSLWIISSAFLWSSCFGIYVLIYAPILWSPRPDGRAP